MVYGWLHIIFVIQKLCPTKKCLHSPHAHWEVNGRQYSKEKWANNLCVKPGSTTYKPWNQDKSFTQSESWFSHLWMEMKISSLSTSQICLRKSNEITAKWFTNFTAKSLIVFNYALISLGRKEIGIVLYLSFLARRISQSLRGIHIKIH